MKSVFLFPNMSKDKIDIAIKSVLDKLSDFDIEIFVSKDCNIKNYKSMDIEDFKGDLIITLGGDGTMLIAINKCIGIPVLGINLGHLGFLTELEINELEYLDKIFNGNYVIDNRSGLNVRILRGNEEILHEIALNDVIVKAENSFRIMDLEVYADDRLALDFSGDGIIVATPTGSTAYSLAAGGAIAEPECRVICVTPICSHKLNGKAFIFSDKREIRIKTEQRNQIMAYIAVDGNNSVRIYPNDTIKITKSNKCIPFIRVKGKTFFDVLKKKIGG